MLDNSFQVHPDILSNTASNSIIIFTQSAYPEVPLIAFDLCPKWDWLYTII